MEKPDCSGVPKISGPGPVLVTVICLLGPPLCSSSKPKSTTLAENCADDGGVIETDPLTLLLPGTGSPAADVAETVRAMGVSTAPPVGLGCVGTFSGTL